VTTLLDDIFVNDSQLFKVSVYDTDGVTLVTPLSVVCSVWNADTDVNIVNGGAGTVGTGYAQYNWAGTATAANYEATLTVTVSSGVVISEHFRVTVRSKPPVFTNDPETDIGKVRLELGDDVEGRGVRPGGSNLLDAALEVWLDREGGIMPAVAAACEALSRQWAGVANIALGPRREELAGISEAWAKRGAELRAQYGGMGYGGFSVSMTRIDGYSENADSVTEFSL
jgi:hypothetical protein